MTQALSDQLAVIATIDPASISTGTVSTDVIDLRLVRNVIFVVAAGTLGSSATLDFAVKGDSASGGSFTTTVTGKSITQLTKAGSDDNKQVIVEVSAEEAAAQGFRYVRGALTIGTAASQACVVALAGGLRYSPASDVDLATVDEIVN
ncbi:MAG: hypothetical protein IT320_03450 [Anaerolineae bacterium]|nr:hypothetical protein [Anaerolineae bacterium]